MSVEVGVSHDVPYRAFNASGGRALNALKRSTIPCRRERPTLNVFARRISIWLYRSSNIVWGGTTLAIVTFARAPAARLRPSDGAANALLATKLADCATPG